MKDSPKTIVLFNGKIFYVLFLNLNVNQLKLNKIGASA